MDILKKLLHILKDPNFGFEDATAFSIVEGNDGIEFNDLKNVGYNILLKKLNDIGLKSAKSDFLELQVKEWTHSVFVELPILRQKLSWLKP